MPKEEREERRISPALAIIPIGLGLCLLGVLAALALAKPPTVYTCPFCGATFSTNEELLAHMETKHPGEVIKPYLIEVNLPPVLSGDTFWPEATLYLPPQDTYYKYGFFLDIDPGLLPGDVYSSNIMEFGFVPSRDIDRVLQHRNPLLLDSPDNIYTVKGTRFYYPWDTQPSRATYLIKVPTAWGFTTEEVPIPVGEYPVSGYISIIGENLLYPPPNVRPGWATSQEGEWRLGVVGTLEVI